MPWSEKQRLALRFEAFNVTNTQRMGAIDGSRRLRDCAHPGGAPYGCSCRSRQTRFRHRPTGLTLPAFRDSRARCSLASVTSF